MERGGANQFTASGRARPGSRSTSGVMPTSWMETSPGVRYWAMVSLSADSSPGRDGSA